MSWRKDDQGNVWIPEARAPIGQVRTNHHARRRETYIVFRDGRQQFFPGRNAIFTNEDVAAQALVDLVRGEIGGTR